MPKDESHKSLLVTLELVFRDIAEVEARGDVIRFVDQGIGVCDQPFQVNPHEKRLPPFLDLIEQLMEHGTNTTEGHSSFSDDNRAEVVNKVRIDILILVPSELLEQVPAVINSGEDIVRLEGKVWTKSGLNSGRYEGKALVTDAR